MVPSSLGEYMIERELRMMRLKLVGLMSGLLI
jgi:hypothetical protein